VKFRPLLRRLHIRDKRANIVPFRLNWAQERYVDAVEEQAKLGKPMRVIVLKARQLGISTLTEGCLFSLSLAFSNMAGLVVAHENDASEHLLSITNLYWETFPFRSLYDTKYLSRKHIQWDNGSQMKIATAKNVTSGRSKTLNLCHLSEYGFYERADEVMLGLRQTIPTVPRSFICIESTANGVGGSFYEYWMASEAGDTEFTPLFFPWQEHPEYRASAINMPHEDLGYLDEEERLLQKIGVTDDSLAWRRWAIRNLCGNDVEKFHQEYPATPGEAFVASGRNVFPIRSLRACYEPMEGAKGRLNRIGERFEFNEDFSGSLTVYRWPSADPEWGQYFVAGDPTHTTRGDYACAQVINRRTLEQVAVLHERCDPSTFGQRLLELGKYYNDAWISTEATGPGYATVGYLVGQGYPKLWQMRQADKEIGFVSASHGWNTTNRTKEWAVGHLLKLVVDQDLTIHDEVTFLEMRDFVSLDGNIGYGPALAGGHDDTVMAMAIAQICNHSEAPLETFGQGQGTERLMVAGQRLMVGEKTDWGFEQQGDLE